MTGRRHAPVARSDGKQRPVAMPVAVDTVVANVVADPIGPLAEMNASFRDGSAGQATQLGNPSWQGAQHQALAAQIGRMQGNRHLRRMVASLEQDRALAAAPVESAPVEQGSTQHESVATFHLSARVRRADKPGAPALDRQGSASAHLWSGAVDSDAFEGEEGPTVVEEGPGKIVEEESDSVDGKSVAYKATIDEGEVGLTTSQAGRCGWMCEMKNVGVTSGEGAYTVTATAQCTIRWQVHAAGGLLPTRTNVESETDAAITKDNYTQVASDLMPRKTKPRRSPRAQFWSRDLTIKHEKFHADERANNYGKEAFKFAQTWLNTQTATSEEQAKEHADKVPSKMSESFSASYKPRCEHRAYDDGAPLYEARAKKIKGRGEKGEYK